MSAVAIDGPRVAPASGGKPDYLVILSHGYGADGNDLIALAPYWQQLLPGAAFVAPNAPERCEMSPIGYQWFGITGLDPDTLYQGVTRAAPTLDAFIDRELERAGLDESRLALVGFSQGTMMSLHVGLRRAKAPAAILGFSGALAGPEQLAAEMRVKPPVMMIHGDSDDMLPVTMMHNAVQALGQEGLEVQWHVSPGIGHGIGPDGLELGGAFVSDKLLRATSG
jgi:phospholipase/carboxylesterase